MPDAVSHAPGCAARYCEIRATSSPTPSEGTVLMRCNVGHEAPGRWCSCDGPGKRHRHRLVEQFLDACHEARCMREARVQFESTSIAPSRVDVELTGISNRMECLVAEATRPGPSRSFGLCNG